MLNTGHWSKRLQQDFVPKWPPCLICLAEYFLCLIKRDWVSWVKPSISRSQSPWEPQLLLFLTLWTLTSTDTTFLLLCHYLSCWGHCCTFLALYMPSPQNYFLNSISYYHLIFPSVAPFINISILVLILKSDLQANCKSNKNDHFLCLNFNTYSIAFWLSGASLSPRFWPLWKLRLDHIYHSPSNLGWGTDT